MAAGRSSRLGGTRDPAEGEAWDRGGDDFILARTWGPEQPGSRGQTAACGDQGLGAGNAFQGWDVPRGRGPATLWCVLERRDVLYEQHAKKT